jgi:hypothetical protein
VTRYLAFAALVLWTVIGILAFVNEDSPLSRHAAVITLLLVIIIRQREAA